MHPYLRFTGFRGKRLHLGICGSVAAYKIADVVRQFSSTHMDVGVTLTSAACEFVSPQLFAALGADPVYATLFSGTANREIHGHLYPGQFADALLIAPATANILAKAAHGLADDMLSCQLLSYPRPMVFAPAMNPRLWHAVATQANCALLRERGHVILEPEEGVMACGEHGKGRLPESDVIFLSGLRALAPQDLAGKRILITLGPTQEYWDAVRFLSNPSSGVMGLSLACAAWIRGAHVHVVSGPVALDFPPLFTVTHVTGAEEMYEACRSVWGDYDVACFCAAVADYRPPRLSGKKLSKTAPDFPMTLPLTVNTDILRSFCAVKTPGQRAIGFCAETADLPPRAWQKLQAKGADLLVANRVDLPDSGFGSPTNQVLVVDRSGRQEQWPMLSKPEVAWRIWDWLPLL